VAELLPDRRSPPEAAGATTREDCPLHPRVSVQYFAFGEVNPVRQMRLQFAIVVRRGRVLYAVVRSDVMSAGRRSVVIIGGGLGGLTLANLLQPSDALHVRVFERDANAQARSQGYSFLSSTQAVLSLSVD
jgi:hypothetical protein